MNVKLVSLTSSKVDEKELTGEELIVYIGRVSNPSNQLNTETSSKLIGYLIKHAHWSPFEMVDMTVEIKTSRAIAAQILRHRSFSFQEFSQRYSDALECEPIELRRQAVTNRQSSTHIIEDQELRDIVEETVYTAFNNYQKLLDAGVARECARMLLPLATQTTLYMKGSVRSWIHYLQVRLDEHTQKEHREIAKAIYDIFNQNFPNVCTSLLTNSNFPNPSTK
jgi:thymidylate synthase (FAD)